MFGVSKIYIFYLETITFILQRHINLITSDSKYVYNVRK